MLENLYLYVLSAIILIVSYFLFGCSLIKTECLEAPDHVVCMENYDSDIPCYPQNSEEKKFYYTQEDWEDKKVGRFSMTPADYIKVKERLNQLEAITCE